MRLFCGKFVFYGILSLLVFAPLAFGSVHVWAYAVVEIGVFALSGVFVLGRIFGGNARETFFVRMPAALPVLGFLLIIGFQMIPLPFSVILALSPETAELHTRTASITGEMEARTVETRKPDTAPPSLSAVSSALAANRHAAVREALKLVSYVLMFFLVINVADSRKRMEVLALTLVLLGLFEAFYAIFQVFNISPRVWWMKSRAGGGRFASGTFIGSNHFAGYMEMALFTAWGYVLSLKQTSSRMEAGLGGVRAGFQRVLGWFSPESVKPRKVFFTFAAVIIGVALLLSGSRGGILSAGLALLVMTGMFVFRKRNLRTGLVSLLCCLVTLLYGLSIGIDPTLEKFENTRGLTDRLAVSKTLIPMIRDFPAAGVGWGNFPDRYPPYAIPGMTLSYYNGYAHNDWLEAGTETGIPGLVLMFAAFRGLFVRMARIRHKRKNPFAAGMGAGVLAAMISIGFHSFFDFNLHIPANPLTLAAILGLGYAALHHRGVGYGVTFFYKTLRIPLPAWAKPVYALMGLSAAALLIWPAVAHLRAEVRCPTEWNSTLNLAWDPSPADMAAASRINPENSEYRYRTGEFYLTRDSAHATAALIAAVRLNPGRAKYWTALAAACENRKDDLYGYLTFWVPLADACHDMAVRLAPGDPGILFDAAGYWVWRANLLPDKYAPDPPPAIPETRTQGIRHFQHLYRQYLRLRPNDPDSCVARVKDYFDDESVAVGIVPPENREMLKTVLKSYVNP